MSDLRFANPARLWLIAVVAVLVAVALAVRVVRRRRAEPFAEPALLPSVAPLRPGWRRGAALVGAALATVALTTAFAEPEVLVERPQHRALVVVALDTSTSMLLTDIAPDRATAAKQQATEFIEGLPDGVDVALVAYHSIARLVVAPTSDHAAAAAEVDRLELAGGTAMGDALLVAKDAVASWQPDTEAGDLAQIVVLADGDTTMGTALEEALPQVVEAGVPVTTIAFGTTSAPVPVNTDRLASVAGATGGSAYTASGAADLSDVYEQIGTDLVDALRRVDVADLAAGIGLALLVATAVPSLFWFSRLA